MTLDERKNKISQEIETLTQKCYEVSNYLTENPEISLEEEKSSVYVAGFLKNEGYDVEMPYKNVQYSFLAVDKAKESKNLPKIAILCEYDALPDIGHGCGHSVSCGISLLCALAIRQALEDFPMQIDIIGTPAEEFGGGKILLADAGAFDGYEFAAMAHLFVKNAPVFKVLASVDMDVKFFGKSAHASATPWEGRNALNAVQLFFHALDMMRQHLTPDCQIHGVITNGGVLPSIVPEEASCYIYPRAGSMQNLNLLWDRMEKCAKGAAMATETTCEIKSLYPAYGDLYSTPTGQKLMYDLFREQEMPFEDEIIALGSTDIGNVDLLIPSFQPGVKIGNDPDIKLHSKEFADLMKSDEAIISLKNGAKIIANLCLNLAYDKETLAQIKLEHSAHRKA
ncbi:MAG: M20 family metallopeptidase [Clostridia bacterium]